jgi:molybdate transport system substrate-binding protein
MADLASAVAALLRGHGHIMRFFLISGIMAFMTAPLQAETIKLYSAGSLRSALTEVARDFEAAKAGAAKVETTFGASGLLRERIEAGETAHVFASADTGHPNRLAIAGRIAGTVQIFARNQLCALAREGFGVTTDTLLDKMLDPAVRLGISTPKADPSGDYAFALFAKSEALSPGAKWKLEAKALQLTGGPASPKPPEGKSLYAWVMTSGQADLFLTYCTNAVQAKAEAAGLSIVAIPSTLNVGADYGLVVLKDAPRASADLVAHIRSPRGQAILAKFGFGAGD